MATIVALGPAETGPAGTASSRAADEIVARLERIPFTRFHLRLATMLGVGTFFDAFDPLAISVALAVIFTSLHVSFVNAGLLIGAAYVGQFFGAIASDIWVNAGAVNRHLSWRWGSSACSAWSPPSPGTSRVC